MGQPRQLAARIRALFTKRKFESEMAEEMRLHLELRTEQNVAAGMSPEDAKHAAQRSFGGTDQIKERCRGQRNWVWLEQSVKDLRHGMRQLRKSPVFTTVAVLSLALGIGGNTAVFSTIETMFIRGLPVRDPGGLVLLSVTDIASAPGRQIAFSYQNYEQFCDHSQTLAGLSAVTYVHGLQSIATGFAGSTTHVDDDAVSGNFFSLLGVKAHLGRILTPDDDRPNAPSVVVLGYAYWQRRFGGDFSVLGKTILLNDAPFIIVGVAPAGFFGVNPGFSADLWFPVEKVRLVRDDFTGFYTDPESFMLNLIGRLKPGVTRETAASEVDLLFQRDMKEVLTQHPQFGDHYGKVELLSGGSGYIPAVEQNKRVLTILMVVTGLVLVVACTNVISLQLARIAARQRELAVLAALGAGRGRLIWRLMTESLVLAVIGGAIGLLIAHWGTQTLFRYIPAMPRNLDLTPDGRVVLFSAAISAAAAICVGLIPAMRFSKANLFAAIKDQGFTHTADSGQRMMKTMVAIQIALSVCLLAGTGLFVRTLENLKGMDLGFSRDNLLYFNIRVGDSYYDAARVFPMTKVMLSALEALPGVRNAAVGQGGLTAGARSGAEFHVEGYVPQQGDQMAAAIYEVGPNYFQTLSIPVLQGREFNDADMIPAANQPEVYFRPAPNPNAPIGPSVAIVNEWLARKYFGGGNPMGRIIHLGTGTQAFRVIGVAKNTVYDDLREAVSPEIYLPSTALLNSNYWIQVHTTENPLSVAANIRAVIHRVDPSIIVNSISSGDDIMYAQTTRERTIAQVSSGFSLFALTLACLGLYGVLAYNVTLRTREIGVRMALGAQTGDITSLIVKKGVTLAVIGCALGVAAAVALSRFVASFLYGVSAIDPFTLAVAVAILTLVAFLASWLPARRATRIDPMIALRAE